MCLAFYHRLGHEESMSRQADFRIHYPDILSACAEHFPEFDYRSPKGSRDIICDYSNPQNQVGHQQRAFSAWWAIELCGPTDLGLDLGSQRGLTPFCIHMDSMYDGLHEHPFYGGVAPSDVVGNAADPTFFPPRTFPFISSNHSLEHMPPAEDAGTVSVLRRWISLLRSGGLLAMVIPDNAYFDVMASDRDHKHAWSHTDFLSRILDPLRKKESVELLEYDTLQNKFSFNVLLKRTS
jgi:hypothetical protein